MQKPADIRIPTKAEAIAAYQGNASDLARALNITPQAIYQWPDDSEIPEAQGLKLLFVLKPGYPWAQPRAPALVGTPPDANPQQEATNG